MKHKRLSAIVLSSLLLFSGCTSKPAVSTNVEKNPAASVPADAPAEPAKEKFMAPYTGLEVTKEAAANPAFMVIIENAAPARPQSGFAEADIVFEAMTEGGVTRFLALYQSEKADKIGPVRSMRTYFIDIAYEYNLAFAHCGGSHDALDRIKKENPMSLNEFVNGSSYWRDPSIKVQEHGLFTSSEKMINLIVGKGYVKPQAVKLSFDKSYWDKLASEANSTVTVKFNGSYTTSYDFKDGLYYKSMNNKPSLNKEDKKPVAVANVVIQNVKFSSRPKELYLDADLIGKGDGYIISGGKSVKVTWSRKDLKSQTIFKDVNGNVVPLSPGKTWWHVFDQGAQLTIK
jgi:hypothetical protein